MIEAVGSLCSVLPPLTLHRWTAGPLDRWTVEDYTRMIDAGILTADDRVELIEGEIVELAPIGSVHGASVDALTRFPTLELDDRYHLRVKGQVQLPPCSQPQPDLAVLLPRPDRYRSAQPGPSDIVLVIEVADSSLATDRARKVPMCGRAGVAEAWLVDLVAETVEVYRHASRDGYMRREVRRRGAARRVGCRRAAAGAGRPRVGARPLIRGPTGRSAGAAGRRGGRARLREVTASGAAQRHPRVLPGVRRRRGCGPRHAGRRAGRSSRPASRQCGGARGTPCEARLGTRRVGRASPRNIAETGAQLRAQLVSHVEQIALQVVQIAFQVVHLVPHVAQLLARGQVAACRHEHRPQRRSTRR